MSSFTVSILGLGYIGLPTAAVLADKNCRVIGIDVNQAVVDKINAGQIHIVEPGIEDLVARHVADGNLKAATSCEPADAFLIAVPTPFKGDHEPDLSYIKAAAHMLAPVLEKGNIVILESTSPVGTTELLAEWLSDARPDLSFPRHYDDQSDICVAHCPERVLPGRVIEELVANDRVIGGLSKQSSDQAVTVYKKFVEGECIVTDARTAEMCKLTENSFRDVNIGFANELSIICDHLNINVWELIQLANRHPRVNILQPGPGVGGHCIAVDPWFIVHSAPEFSNIIHSARKVNDGKPAWVVSKIMQSLEEQGQKSGVVACLGLSFKPNIDDLRESPAIEVVNKLAEIENLTVLAVEPHIEKLPNLVNSKVDLVDINAALAKADVVALLVDHDVFKTMQNPQITSGKLVDTRGLWDAHIAPTS